MPYRRSKKWALVSAVMYGTEISTLPVPQCLWIQGLKMGGGGEELQKCKLWKGQKKRKPLMSKTAVCQPLWSEFTAEM